MATVNHTPLKSNLHVYPIRFLPNEDLLENLIKFVKEANLKAPFIMTCCGSLKEATIRLANVEKPGDNQIITLNDKYEIVSLVGTLSQGGHLHISLSDKKGAVIGGHVVEKLIIFTTAEVVIGDCMDVVFERNPCQLSGWDELVVKNKRSIL